jgi:hypothetical protein
VFYAIHIDIYPQERSIPFGHNGVIGSGINYHTDGYPVALLFRLDQNVSHRAIHDAEESGRHGFMMEL